MVLACLVGCEEPPQPEPVVNPPVPVVEQPVLDPVHIGEDRLRSPLLEGLRQQIERTETEDTREVLQPLTQQLETADAIMSDARQRNRSAIQQANRQVRMGAARLSPNFVLLTVDRMGVGDLGCYGQTRWNTPSLDKLAASGQRFTQFYAGVDPVASRSMLLSANITTASARATLMPRVLWNAGYKTALIGEWSSDSSPERLGYEESSGWNASSGEFPNWALLNGKRISLENNSGGQKQISQTDFVTSEVRSFLREASSRPNQFFLQVSVRLFDDAASRSPNADDYAAQIQRADTLSGRVLDALTEFGLENRTCVVFCALAGPHPAFHQLVGGTQSTGEFSHSAEHLREGNLRVPFLVRWPGQIPEGTVSESVAGLWDVLPTFAQLAWVSRPLGRVDGQSLVEVLRHQQPLKDRRCVWKSPDNARVLAAREGRWKAVRIDADRSELFDLSSDLREERNVAAEHDDVLQRLLKP